MDILSTLRRDVQWLFAVIGVMGVVAAIYHTYGVQYTLYMLVGLGVAVHFLFQFRISQGIDRGFKEMKEEFEKLKSNPKNPSSSNPHQKENNEEKTTGIGALAGMVVGGIIGLPFGAAGVLIGGVLGGIIGDLLEAESIGEKKKRKEKPK